MSLDKGKLKDKFETVLPKEIFFTKNESFSFLKGIRKQSQKIFVEKNHITFFLFEVIEK